MKLGLEVESATPRYRQFSTDKMLDGNLWDSGRNDNNFYHSADGQPFSAVLKFTPAANIHQIRIQKRTHGDATGLFSLVPDAR